MATSLPDPSADQPYWHVSVLEGGHLTLREEDFIDPHTPGAKATVPSLCFLLRHSATGTTFLFDLGLRKDGDYPPVIRTMLDARFQPVIVAQDVADSLRAGGVDPAAINHVCLSHIHFDHTGDSTPFTHATFLVGAAAAPLLARGFPAHADSQYRTDTVPPAPRTRFLDPAGWPALGPFSAAFDFAGDGSLYIVDAPGHLPGHVNVLARTSADGGWVYLAGDAAHDWRLLRGEVAIAERTVPGKPGTFTCAHADRAGAEAHIAQMRELLNVPRLRLLLAHDLPWYEKNKGGSAFLPGTLESL
ncbi:beta-lactamase-like protein [Gloeopeniophorella convolvens]|nr:beta-lactamase-like protein [Gloeopeniophorella convolvens]